MPTAIYCISLKKLLNLNFDLSVVLNIQLLNLIFNSNLLFSILINLSIWIPLYFLSS